MQKRGVLKKHLPQVAEGLILFSPSAISMDNDNLITDSCIGSMQSIAPYNGRMELCNRQTIATFARYRWVANTADTKKPLMERSYNPEPVKHSLIVPDQSL